MFALWQDSFLYNTFLTFLFLQSTYVGLFQCQEISVLLTKQGYIMLLTRVCQGETPFIACPTAFQIKCWHFFHSIACA